MKKTRVNAAFKLITVFIIIFLALTFIIGYSWNFIGTTDYFKIRDIIARGDDTSGLSYLKGKNIFRIDLRKESLDILEYYPGYSRIKLVRLLPDRIYADFIKRKPIALVKLYKYFCLDEEGVLFNLTGQSDDPGLPLIVGLETKIFGPKPGRKYNIREVALALNIIRELKRNKALGNYKISKINIGNPADASIFIFEGLEVKLGSDEIKERVSLLNSLIMQERLNLANIKYIDLRFKEPVIKFKDAK